MGVDETLDDDRDIDQTEYEHHGVVAYMPPIRDLVDHVDDLIFSEKFETGVQKFIVSPLGRMQFNGWNYYDYGSSVGELIEKAKSIRSRYMDFREYDEAMNVYWDYMELLSTKYGNPKILKKLRKLKLVKDFVPKKPKLKNTKANREYLKYGMLPSMTCIDPKINPYDNDEVRQMIEEMFPVTQEDLAEMDRKLSPDYEMTKEERKYYKEEAKWAKKAIAAVAGNPRKRSIYDNNTQKAVDSIQTYFNNISGKKKEDEDPHLKYKFVPTDKNLEARFGEDYNPYERLPLTEVLKYQDYEDEGEWWYPEEKRVRPIEMWQKEQWQPGATIGANGAYVKYDELLKLEILKEMAEEGFDVMKIYGKSMTKGSVRMLRRYAGRSATMTKKEMKKYEKRQKKANKELKRKAKEDSGIRDILLNNNELRGLKNLIDDNGNIKAFSLSDMPQDYE